MYMRICMHAHVLGVDTHGHVCTHTQGLALGLLTGEAASKSDIDSMFNAIALIGTPELDIWVNLWTLEVLDLWSDQLASFLADGA